MNPFFNVGLILVAAIILTSEMLAISNRTYKSDREAVLTAWLSVVVVGVGLFLLTLVEW